MKKYIITLAAMAVAIGGCTQQPELTGDTTGKDAPPVVSEEEAGKDGAENKEESGADSTDPSKGGGDKK